LMFFSLPELCTNSAIHPPEKVKQKKYNEDMPTTMA